MSVKAMSMVWENSKQSGSALLMLLAIADHAKDDGTGAWPSLATLARKTRMSRRNAIEIIKKLEDEGEIIVRRGAGPRGCNMYDLAFSGEAQFTSKEETKEKPVKPTSPEVVNPDSPTVVKPTSPELVKPDSPEPSSNHHLTVTEPPERGAAEKTPPAPASSGDYLTDAFLGNVQMREGEKLIQLADWDIRSPEHRQAVAAFLEASRLPVPDKKTERKDWIGCIDTHLHICAANDLDEGYPHVVAHMRGDGLTVSRPGSVTNNLRSWWAEEKNGGKPNGQHKRSATQRDPDETFFDPASGQLVRRDPGTGDLVPVS